MQWLCGLTRISRRFRRIQGYPEVVAGRIAWLAVVGGCAFDPSGIGATDTPIDAREADADPNAPDASEIDAGESLQCPDGYQASGRGDLPHQYRLVNEQVTWTDAVVDCANDGQPQTYLVVVDTTVEDQLVDAFSTNRDVWLGASDEATEGVFRTILGDVLPYEDFTGPEPDNGGDPDAEPGQDCVLMLDGGLWNDRGCETEKFRFVCECGRD
jgi:hypothetical protein